MKIRRITALAMAGFLTINMAACSSSKSAAQTSTVPAKITAPVTIEFWHAVSGPQEKELRKLAVDFMAKNKNITVNLVAQGNYDDLSKKLMAAAKAHNSPALAMAYEDWQTGYIKNHLIEDLTPYKESKDVGISDSSYNDIVKVFRDANTWNGEIYGMPFNKSTEILFYNTDYFSKFGLSAPKTWDDLKNDAKTLTTTINGRKVTGMGFENSLGMDFPTYVEQAGGTAIDDASGKVKFNSAEGKDALNFLYGMFKDGTGKMAGEDQYISNPFTRGDVAMCIGSCAGISYVKSGAKGKVNWATAPLPEDKKAAVPFMGTNLVVFSSASAQQKLAAWEFIKYLTGKDQTLDWAENTGYVPIRNSVLNDDQWKNFVSQNPAYAPAEEQFGVGYYYSRLPGSDEVNNTLETDIEAVLLGKQSVDDGLKKAADDCQKNLDDAKD